MQTGNPAFNDSVLDAFTSDRSLSRATMSVSGTAMKTLVLLGFCTASAIFTWGMVWDAIQTKAGIGAVMPWAIGGAIAGLVFSLITGFVPRWAVVTAPLYAIAEGLFLGAFSAIMEMQYPGIAIQGVAATFGTAFALMFAYTSGVVRATEKFKAGIMAATGAIAIVYLVNMVMGMFGMQVPYIHQSGMIGIGFSVVVVIIAALNLILDFDFIEQSARAGAPKSMEWYGAFGLMVTLVWLYIEIVRLLAKLNSSRD
jgi:uncharacterized YccA/Bax inhibitor family protein